ncbi:MAG TPA: tRNA pseudouridine(55) synthase TruB [Burkholderiales bacterium]|jgi:tRNA pseudouridine55 synthase|nr:tRNA pseudouridine(55) synthase TruB [Burkholderiales bacterium]
MIDGALLLDKPVGITSNGALQEAKRLLRAKKAGHGGTLDPLASGLLVLLFGEATKFAGPLLDSDKEYLATLELGSRTDTGDAEGKVLEVRPVNTSAAELSAVLERFRGAIDQVPPMYSALKHDGVPLYKLARKGRTVERAARQVQISELELLGYQAPLAQLRVRCSKGTYIRSLGEDIGAALGTGAHLAALRRTGAGRFRVEDAVSLDALRATPAASQRLLALAELLADIPATELDAAAEARLRNGQPLKISGLQAGLRALYRSDGALIGLGRAHAEGELRALRLTQAADKHRKTL